MSDNSLPDPISDETLRRWAENVLEKPKVLQDLALIPIDQAWLSLPYELYRQSPIAKAALSDWEKQIRDDDRCFRFEEHRWIPRIEVYVPTTPEGEQFLKISKAIGDIPMQTNILPKNQQQAYWLKTLHYFYQARGVLFAYKLLGVIPDPIQSKGLFHEHLATKIITNLDLVTEVDVAEYKLIKAGLPYLQEWTRKHSIHNPLQIFLEAQKQAFLEGWASGLDSNDEWIAIEKQNDLLAVRIRLLQQSAWIKGGERRGSYQKQEQEYLAFLTKNGWYGRMILALRPHSESHLEQPWQHYVKALRNGKSAYIDDFYWRNGLPYSSKAHAIAPTLVPCSSIAIEQCDCPFRRWGGDLSASHCLKVARETAQKTQRTAERAQVKGTINLLGYLVWVWA